MCYRILVTSLCVLWDEKPLKSLFCRKCPQVLKWHIMFHSELGLLSGSKWLKLIYLRTYFIYTSPLMKEAFGGAGGGGVMVRRAPQTIYCVSMGLFSRIPAWELPLDGVNPEISLESLLCTKMRHILSMPKPFPENGFLILCLNSLFTEPTRNLRSKGIKRLNLKPLALSL